MNVQYSVTPVQQPDLGTDCWAASFAMLLGTTCEDVAARSNMPLGVGYGWTEIENAMRLLGLSYQAPACMTVEGWYGLLQSLGPMWLVIASSYTATSSHAIVLIGMIGDGTDEGTTFRYIDPGDASYHDVTYEQLESIFEYGSIANAEIVYRG
jgi:hypothetical protein